MFLSITLNNHTPASNLGYLLHKHPDRKNSKDLNWGEAHIFFPEVKDSTATAVLLLEVDSLKLQKGSKSSGNPMLSNYINDRPFVASSLLSTAISKCFGTAMNGRCQEDQSLADTEYDFTVKLAALPCKGQEQLLHDLFEPLGYDVTTTGFPLNNNFPEWGQSKYYNLELKATKKLGDILSHIYLMIPVLDIEKHYWVGKEEIEKLVRHGQDWLPGHPLRKLIIGRYLRKSGELARQANKLFKEMNIDEADLVVEEEEQEETIPTPNEEKPLNLHSERHLQVIHILKKLGSQRIVDLGCGEGKFLRRLADDPHFTKIVGLDISIKALEVAKIKLRLDRASKDKRDRIKLMHGSLMYQDSRIKGFDAATVIEVIEHMEAYQLQAFERVVFEFTKPQNVIVTTPNVEYNVLFENLPEGKHRHGDHRFEWTRLEFQTWATRISTMFGYTVEFHSIGPEHPEHGAPSQMAIFTRKNENESINP